MKSQFQLHHWWFLPLAKKVDNTGLSMEVSVKPLKMLALAAGMSYLKEMLAKGDENVRWIFPSWHPWPCQLAAFQSQEPFELEMRSPRA